MGWALGCWYVRERGTDRSRAGLSARLRRSFERLGSTYIKLGQIVSGGDGLFPEELVREFKRLRDRVPAESFAVVRAIVEEDLGRPLDEVFAEFDEQPLAAASIAQVHAAVLRTGESVVVKVQRPTVARRVRDDLRALAWLGPRMVGRIPSPRSRTRRRSWSCSRRRSSRSSTSGSRPRTCSTSRTRSRRSACARRWCRGRTRASSRAACW